MTVLEALQSTKHIDEDGLVLEDPNPGDGPNTGNGLHGLGVAAALSHRRGERDVELALHCDKVISSCYVQGYPGLLHRGPRKTGELIAHDDVKGAMLACRVMGLSIHADLIHRRLVQDRWSYDNLSPGKWSARSFLARHPGFVAHVQICAGVSPSWLMRQYLAYALAVPSDNPGGLIKEWLMVVASEAYDEGSIACARKIWVKELLKKYPKGMRDVFAAYYGPDHPFTELGVAC